MIPSRLTRRLGAGFICAPLLLTPALHAALIVNGSFEDPAEAADGLYGFAGTGWSGNAPFLFRGEFGGWPAPQHGEQFVDLGWGEIAEGEPSFALWQVVTITTPGTYQLEWYHNTFGSVGPGSALYRVAVLDAADSPVAEGLFDAENTGPWVYASLTAALAAGDYTVKFSSGPSGGLDTLLDNVGLTLVPEPGAYAALAALGCLGWGAWRRRAAPAPEASAPGR